MVNQIVSVVIPMKNSERTIGACLRSIRANTYAPIEIVIGDNGSTDDSVGVAREYADHLIFVPGLRTSVRNVASQYANGDYLLHIDSDMVLESDVVEECVRLAVAGADAVIIPERDWVTGYWMRAAMFTRTVEVPPPIEGARFIEKRLFDSVGGYNEYLESGEDFDLHFRVVNADGRVERANTWINHDIRRLGILGYLRKQRFYASTTSRFLEINSTQYEETIGSTRRMLWSYRHEAIRKPLLFAGWMAISTLTKVILEVEKRR